MLEWFSTNFNLPTIVIALILVAIVVWDIRKLLEDRKKGCSSCGGSCSGCSGCGTAGSICNTREIPERFRAKKDVKKEITKADLRKEEEWQQQ